MSRNLASTIGRIAARSRAPVGASSLLPRLSATARIAAPRSSFVGAPVASISTSARLHTPIPAEQLKSATPAPLTEEEFHIVADMYIEDILTQFEELQETREDVDVEYSVSHHPFSTAP